MTSCTSFNDLPDIFDVKQLKDYMGIGKEAAYALMHRKGFPVIKVGSKTYRVSKKGFEKWLEKQVPVN